MRPCLVFFFLATIPLLAQSPLTRNDVFEAGETADYLSVDATGAEPGPEGIGVTWDFSNLPRMPQEDYSVSYAEASTAPNAAQFPNANLVSIQDAGETTAYTFYEATNSRFTLEGLDLPEIGVVTYSDKSVWIDFPFGYGDMQSDDFVGTYVFDFSGISGIADRTGTLTTTYDGFGTIILPSGERIENVRRLKIDQTVRDDVNVAGTSIITEVVSTTYNWFAEGDRTQVFQLTIGESTVTPPGMTTPGRSASYRDGGVSSGPSLQASRGAHLTTQGGDFNSEIIIRNPTDSTQSLTLQPYDGNGGTLSTVPVTLEAGATSRVLQETYFASNAASFTADGCSSCIFSVGYRANTDNASTAQVHQTNRFANEFSFYPGEWSYLFDGAAVVNVGSAAASVEAVQYAGDGSVLNRSTLSESLAAGAKTLAIFNTLFTEDANSVVKIESDQPMAVMTLRISNDGRFLYQNQPLPQVPSQGDARWIAHIASEIGGFDTDIYIHNTSGSDKTVVLSSFAVDGSALQPVVQTIAGNATLRFAKTDLLPADASHILVTGETEALVSVGYRSQVPESSTAPIHEAAPVGNTFYLYPGEWDVLFDGVAMVNTGDAATDIMVSQIDGNGVVTANVTLVEGLAPLAKHVGLFEGTIPENPNTIIKVEASQPLAVLALRISKDSRYLYGNNVLPQ